ncbi:MAG: two-component system, OmpR family, phosphate regulon response regulator PhoB [Elusimicrobia bacterium]|nr:MAG: two-component system, OmpR family, phosphate regulon response regulator PhoB [Elusimicrobiota bacterium]
MTTATQTTVLLVDDDAHFRETLADAMSLKDVRVESAGSVADARRALAQRLPSVILLDVQLPDLSGIELCRQLKRDPRTKGVPVVLLSAKYTEPADRAEGLLTGADAYLSKPINIEALQEEIRYLVDN